MTARDDLRPKNKCIHSKAVTKYAFCFTVNSSSFVVTELF